MDKVRQVPYSGRDNNQHQKGVVIILKKEMEKCLLEWKPINSNLMKMRIRGSKLTLLSPNAMH